MRKIAKEHNVDIAQIHGTGIGGRVTKQDILGFIDGGGAGAAGAPPRRRPGADRASAAGVQAGRARRVVPM